MTTASYSSYAERIEYLEEQLARHALLLKQLALILEQLTCYLEKMESSTSSKSTQLLESKEKAAKSYVH